MSRNNPFASSFSSTVTKPQPVPASAASPNNASDAFSSLGNPPNRYNVDQGMSYADPADWGSDSSAAGASSFAPDPAFRPSAADYGRLSIGKTVASQDEPVQPGAEFGLAPPPLPRRPNGQSGLGSGQTSAGPSDSVTSATGVQQLSGTRAASGNDEAEADTSSFELELRDTLRQAMDDLVQAHQHEMFLLKSRGQPAEVTVSLQNGSAPQRSTTTLTVDSTESEDSATAAFKSAFPSLSRPASPEPSLSSPVPEEPERDESEHDQFAERTQRMTDLLLWQIKQMVEQEVERGSAGWRAEKTRGLKEFEELEEAAEAREEELSHLREKNQDLSNQLAEQSNMHNQDLEAASSSAAELNERVELLQAELNRQEPRAAPAVNASDADDNAWTSIVGDQNQTLAKHDAAFTALAKPLTCTICHEAMRNPTTLHCGHSGCMRCLTEWLRGHGSCPTCREPVLMMDVNLRTTTALESIIQVLKDAEL